jgi:hypothetical protein
MRRFTVMLLGGARGKSFGDDFTVYLIDDSPKIITEAFSSPDADDWTPFSPMELGSWSKDRIVANLWVASGCSRKSLSLMILLTSTRLVLWLRVTQRKKAKIFLILTHLLRD